MISSNSNLNSSTLRKVGTLGAFLGLGLMASEASADILRAVTNVNPQTGTGPATVVPTTSFKTAVANQRVVITFNAECSIGGGPGNWLDTLIVVDPADDPANPAKPTGITYIPPSEYGDNALCSGNHTPTIDGWVSAVTQATFVVPTSGTHLVGVNVIPNPNGTKWWIDDLSLIVENE